MRRLLLPCLLALPFLSQAVTLPYQGILTDAKGNPVVDKKYGLDFNVYSTSSGGASLWHELQAASTSKGLFSVNLGATAPLPDSLLSRDSLFLGISVLGGAELTPRTRLGAVMRSILSTYADTAKFARNALGLVDTARFRAELGGKADTANLTAKLGAKVDTTTSSIHAARIDSIRIKLERYPDSIGITEFLGARYKGNINPDSLKSFESGYGINTDANIPWKWAIYQSLSPYNSSSIQLAAQSCAGCGTKYALRAKDDNNASGKWSDWNTLFHSGNLSASTLPGGPYMPLSGGTISGPIVGSSTANISGNAQIGGTSGISLGSTGIWNSTATGIGSGWPTIWGTNDQQTGNPYIMIPSPHIPYMQASKFSATSTFNTAAHGGSRIRFAADATAANFGDFGILPTNTSAFTSTLPIIGTDATFSGEISEGGTKLSEKYQTIENQKLSTNDAPSFSALQRHHEAQNHAPSEKVYTKILSIDLAAGQWNWFTTTIMFNRGYNQRGSAILALNIANHNGGFGPYNFSLSGCTGFTPDQFILSFTSNNHVDLWLKDGGGQALIDWSFLNYRGIANVTRYSNTSWQTEEPSPISATADYSSNIFLSLQGGTLTGALNGTSASFSGNLSVAGTINGKVVTNGIFASNVADYVFEPEYRLAPLSEVEAYTKEHKHLPEIPSATEIEKGGLDLAQMNLLLLKKVEELTLHAIAQEKKIGEFTHQSIAQEKRLQALEEQLKSFR